MEAPVWIPCSECDYGTESLDDMVLHIIGFHPEYSALEAKTYAEVWQEGAYEEEELRNIERAEDFRRYGRDTWDD